ncbi:ATP-binding protein [Rubellimicrobium roseum]|uniref:ATP-binding protein n=1 Tax=Rubellimicrobium roseum TaxID=687525 RepID=A0A5C4N6M1_9RHOB|nr:ATP-binding protein [Rubellimicrobium roseum]TNC66576.1 ATP-binding protein [Rubellimicrobium roseum]
MGALRSWILEGGLADLTPVALAVRALAEPALGEEGAGDVELALVEAVTNVIRHGYGPEGGPIRVEASVAPTELVLRLFDWGRPIPGEALAAAGLSRFDFDPADLDALPAGGMGLSIIAAVMDEVSYRSDEGQNVLTLLRRLRA